MSTNSYQRFDVKWLQPEYRDRKYVEYETDGILTNEERAVILGVHDRSYENGELAIDPSAKDFKILNDAYKRKYSSTVVNSCASISSLD